MADDKFSFNKLLMLAVGSLVSLLTYFGDDALKSNKETIRKNKEDCDSSLDKLRASIRDVELKNVLCDDAIKRLQAQDEIFKALAEDRGRRLASIEADTKNLNTRMQRVEQHEDQHR